MEKYTVVIPSLANEKTKPYLELCVSSLRKSGFGGEIVVVTNGTKTPEPLNIPGITRRLHTRDQGQCIATNIGAQNCTTPYIMVSNDDMYYAPGWDKKLRFDHPVFSPNLVEPTNNPGSALPFLKFDGGFTLDEFQQEAVDKNIRANVRDMQDVSKEVTEQPGFNLPFFIRKDLWTFLGGYDTVFDPWGSNSDTDLQTRINLAGVTPMRLRDVLVYHFSNKSGTFDAQNDAFRLHNFDYFKEKHGFDRDGLGSDVWMNKDMLPNDPAQIKYKQRPYRG